MLDIPTLSYKNHLIYKDRIMKKTLPTHFPEQNYHKLPYLAVHWETLKTALNLKLFDHLLQPQTAPNISALLESDAKNTEYLLNALTAMGYLHK